MAVVGRPLLLLAVAFLAVAAFLPLPWWKQAIWGSCALLIAVSCWSMRNDSRLRSLFLVFLSCFATLQYLAWRTFMVARMSLHPSGSWHARIVTAILQGVLLAAELVFALELVWGYFATAWPLQRKPMPLPLSTDLWPEVDVLIKATGSSIPMVEVSVLAALNLDWPTGKLRIAILDLQKREALHDLCAELGVKYLVDGAPETSSPQRTGDDTQDAEAPFLGIFDAEHPPVRSFLQVTMGWLYQDPRLALVQTPSSWGRAHGRITNESSRVPAFQNHLDFWGATYFDGSAAVLRRAALRSSHSLTPLVNEEHVASLALQRNGWRTAFLDIPQTAPIRSDRSARRSQIDSTRSRPGNVWSGARELFEPGSTVPQRILQSRSTLQPLLELARIILLLAPVGYLLFGQRVMPGMWAAIIAYAVPHLILPVLTGTRVQSNRVTTPRVQPATATQGDEASDEDRTQLTSAEEQESAGQRRQPSSIPAAELRSRHVKLLLFGANAIALLTIALRAHGLVPEALLRFWAHRDLGAGYLLVQVLWATLNLVLLSASLIAESREPRRRSTPRIPAELDVSLVLPDGRLSSGSSSNISNGGMLMRSSEAQLHATGTLLSLTLHAESDSVSLPAVVLGTAGDSVRFQFQNLSLEQNEALAVLLYSRADAWVGREEPANRLTLVSVITASARRAWSGWSATVRDLFSARDERHGFDRINPTLWLLVLAAPLVAFSLSVFTLPSRVRLHASPRPRLAEVHHRTVALMTQTGRLQREVSMARDGVNPVLLTEVRPSSLWAIDVPQSEVVQRATLRLQYRCAKTTSTSASTLLVTLNDAFVTSIPLETCAFEQRKGPEATPDAGQGLMDQSVQIRLPAELIVSANVIEFRLQGLPAKVCGTEACPGTRILVEPGTSISTQSVDLRAPSTLMPVPRTNEYIGASLLLTPKAAVATLVRGGREQVTRQKVLLCAAWIGSVFLSLILTAWVACHLLQQRAEMRLQRPM